MMVKEDCSFCDEFEHGLIIHGKNYGDRILWSTENFVVFPVLGPIVAGNILIAPKQHYMGVTGIPEQFYDELEEIQEKTKRKVTEVYQPPFFFEHGEVGERPRGGNCIDHAHLQVIPSNVGYHVVAALERKFTRRVVKNYHDLRPNKEQRIPYIDVPDALTSQYVRQIIAVQIGNPSRWDWRNDYRIDEMLIAAERLRS